MSVEISVKILVAISALADKSCYLQIKQPQNEDYGRSTQMVELCKKY